MDKRNGNLNTELLRNQLAEYAKNFKVSWLHLGQGLYSVWQDKLFYAWGYEKFEDYATRELGLKKPLALKLVKTYLFVEQEEPGYLKTEFSRSREAVVVPGYESLDVLRLAHRRTELTRDDYVKLRKDIFDKGKDAALVRKDLTAIIKERKPIDPEQQRQTRHQASVKRFLNALRSFTKDMETLQLIEADIVQEAEILMNKLEKNIHD